MPGPVPMFRQFSLFSRSLVRFDTFNNSVSDWGLALESGEEYG